jgi:beta-mannanase
VILEARERGEVIMACMHVNNPKTGKDSWDNSSAEVVKELLTEGSATQNKYRGWLDRLADFANNLKDSKGNLVPIIFRMYHEHTQEWSWWGSSCTTASEFQMLWQITIQYLRDYKGVHNFLYAISPQMDAVYPDARERLLFRWPGDDWVDFIGMDCYHGTGNSAFISNLEALEALSLAKKKPCGVTEDGLESFTQSDFWSRYLMAPIGEKRISMVTMWRNKYVGNNESDKHYFSVYPGHPSEEDFRKMYSSPRTLFSADLPDMYALPDGYEIK